jgi:hypothetical protein
MLQSHVFFFDCKRFSVCALQLQLVLLAQSCTKVVYTATQLWQSTLSVLWDMFLWCAWLSWKFAGFDCLNDLFVIVISPMLDVCLLWW